MPVSSSRVLGWSPPDNEDFVDVPVSCDVSQLLPLQNPTFHISDPNPVRRLRRTVTGIFERASPSDSDDQSSDGCPADKRVEHTGKHNDPAWVARPRNEFILFRCDYVRKHSREGKRVRRPPGTEVEKTLSKQAAEAWHHLPPEERLYWKERANSERNEHARRYPDYRYCPKKSATGRRRQTRCSSSKPAAASDSKPSSDTVDPEQTHHPGLSEMVQLMSRHSSTATSSESTPRRHASVPKFGVTQNMHRRLRSTASQGWLGISKSSPDFSMREYTPMPTLDSLSTFEPSDYISPDFASGPSASHTYSQSHTFSQTTNPSSSSSSLGQLQPTSSSLLNWNGARMVAASPQPTQFLSSASVSLCSHAGLHNHMHNSATSQQLLAEYTTGGNPDPASLSSPTLLQSQQQQPQQHAHEQQEQESPFGIWMSQMHHLFHDPSDHSQNGTAPDAFSQLIAMDPALQDTGANANGEVASAANDIESSTNNGHASLPYDLSGRPIVGLHPMGDHGSPSALFAMDADEYFDPNY